MIIQLEFNEVTFPLVEQYIAKGKLPHFAKAFKEFSYRQTTSELVYTDIEPWINWVTAHTGKTFKEHGLFRLGDVDQLTFPQIYEVLESQGVTVGAMSPMNASNKTKHAAFWVPDPWTSTTITAPWLLRRIYAAIRCAVNDNAQGKLTLTDGLALMAGLVRYVPPNRWFRYARLALGARRKKWYAAIFLDAYLADIYFQLRSATKPMYSTLFLNAAAHIQHHYMYSSAVYDGPHKNPAWYVAPNADPLLDVYELYDQILGDALQTGSRVIVATALSQEPYPSPIYYYRIKDHAVFLKSLGINFSEVLPRMSRDFLVTFERGDDGAGSAALLHCAATLRGCTDLNGIALFEVDAREDSLFVTLIYANEVKNDQRFILPRAEKTLHGEVVFVAIKNGHHLPVGYLLDTHSAASATSPAVSLASLFSDVLSAFDVGQTVKN
jgi:Type I phosphodiesterase / nucleotide pyrophosphatase